MTLVKYPRTPHLAGSRLQPGDEDLEAVPFEQVAGRFMVVEEKVDGANCAISFDTTGELRLQSRGHFLTGGPRERQFDMLKPWAQRHQQALRDVLGTRYVLYGEWLYARHTVFYDALPHYLLEFDVLDRERDVFLSTEARRSLLHDAPVLSVPVLAEGVLTEPQVVAQVGPTRFKTAMWKLQLGGHAEAHGLDAARVLAETDPSGDMEGLYVKLESDGVVQARYKWVRASFLTTVVQSGSHWMDRPLLPNLLAPGVDLFE